jgi:hypothetical protein
LRKFNPKLQNLKKEVFFATPFIAEEYLHSEYFVNRSEFKKKEKKKKVGTHGVYVIKILLPAKMSSGS